MGVLKAVWPEGADIGQGITADAHHLIATGRDVDQVAKEIGVDGLVYQDLHDLEQSLRDLNPRFAGFESSCFSGEYVTGDVDEAYLNLLAEGRKGGREVPDVTD